MMRTFATVILGLAMMVPAASAAPIHLDFTNAVYAPAEGQQTFTRYEASIDRMVSHEALDNFLNPFGTLTYNNNVEGADGIGMVGKGNYANDEIEGDERYRLRFNDAVTVTGVNFTDFFDEVEPNVGNCPRPGCYPEIGTLMFYYQDGTHSLWNVFNAPASNVRTTNGVFDLAFNESNVVAIVFAAFGILDAQRHEYSVAGVTIDTFTQTTVPEPASLLLLGTGLIWITRQYQKRG
jgi:hypothetical protein